MMPRNLLARVEVLFPVRDPRIMSNIRDRILRMHLSDNTKSWLLNPDGSYTKVTVAEGEPRIRSQEWFIENRGLWHGES